MEELQTIQTKIVELRGQKVMLDFDLAALYEVENKALKQAVRRNIERFEGEDFMFELTISELRQLRSQFVTSMPKLTHYKPFTFTEMGVAMLSSVLRSPKAIQINRGVMRAFVAMREFVTNLAVQSAEVRELRERVRALERGGEETLGAVNDLSEDLSQEIDNIYLAIGVLSAKPPKNERRPMGYHFENTPKEEQ